MSDLTNTIKMIMKYISKKRRSPEVQLSNCKVITIKQDLFFKNHINKSLNRSFSNDKLQDLYSNYCEDNFSENNIPIYK